jgi:Tat protein translocase TatB subunit
MFNVGGGELLVIFLVALIVLGPAKLPEVARQVGGVMREIRRISSGFQDEMRAAMDDPIEAAARERGNRLVATSESPAPVSDLGDKLDDDPDDPDDLDDPDASDGLASAEPMRDEAVAADESSADPAPMSTAAAAGMYDVAPAQLPSHEVDGSLDTGQVTGVDEPGEPEDAGLPDPTADER